MRTPETDCLVIKRSGGIEKGSNRTVCRPSLVTVLTDESGGNIGHYQRAFVGESPEETIIFEYNGASFDPSAPCRVGFGDKLPEDKGIREFILELGVSPEETEEIIEACELRKHLYYNCAQLSATQARQLLLLRALYGREKVVILNDPFQPFNGRWREYFAEALLRNIQERERILIVMNLSFVPLSWSNQDRVKEADIGKMAMTEGSLKDLIKTQQSDLEQLSATDAAVLDRQAAATLRIPVPEPLRYAFKEAKDFIFEPLAKISGMFRGYNGAMMMLGMAVLIVFASYFLLDKINAFHLGQNLLGFNPEHNDQEIQTATQKPSKVNLAPEKDDKLNSNKPTQPGNPDEDAGDDGESGRTVDSVQNASEADQHGSSPQEKNPFWGDDVPLAGGPLCLTEFNEFNLWNWSELPPKEEKPLSGG